MTEYTPEVGFFGGAACHGLVMGMKMGVVVYFQSLRIQRSHNL